MINWIKSKFQAYLDKRFLKRLNRVLKSNSISADLNVKGNIHASDEICYYDNIIHSESTFVPTQGDILILTRDGSEYKTTYILKEVKGTSHIVYATTCGNVVLNELKHGVIINHVADDLIIRLADKSEKQVFLERLRASGYDWDGERIVKFQIN